MRRRPSDRAARDRIANDLDTTFLVEAGAGSGKTTSLVTRMVSLITSGRTPVDRIAAVTFTRKAAAELREKFQEALEEAALKKSGAAAEHARTALGHLGEATIGTIHAFCARLLRERPVEVGLDPEFQELDEGDADRRLDLYWLEFLDQERIADSQALAELIRLGVSPDQLSGLFKRLSQFRDVQPVWKDLPPPDLSKARTALLRLLDRLAKVVPPEEPEKGWDELQSAYRFAQWRRRVFSVDALPDLVTVLERFQGASVTLNRWENAAAARTVRDEELPAFVDGYLAPSLKVWREYLYPFCIQFAAGAVRYAESQRKDAGLLDFGDLLIKARDLLRDNAPVRRAFADRYRYLLVDEFQDTDPIQAEVLFYLAGDAPAPKADWRNWRLRPGALFVVGDPRQSIYRFRRADIDTYTLVKDQVAASGGEVLTLSANFRSVDRIGDVVDAAFRGVFPEQADAFQAAFVPLETDRPGPGRHAGAARLVLPGGSKMKKDEIAATDATHVAAFVAWALAGHVQVEEATTLRPARPGDVMILSLRKEFLERIARALEARQIPYDITGASGFAEDPDVVAGLTLLRCLADRDNPVLVVAALTGRLFGHSYQELYDFKEAGGRFAFLGAQADPAGAARGVLGSLGRLKALWRLTLDRSPAAAVSAILEAVGIVPLAAASPLGAAAGGRLYKLVELIQDAPGTEFADFPAAVEWLDGSVQGEVEPISLLTGARDVVRVMNLHRAKGLEAPLVLLAAPWGNADHEPEFHVDRTRTGQAVGYFVVREESEYSGKLIALPPEWETKAEKEKQYLAAERDRMRYVAATRAKQLLVVSHSPREKENPWGPLLPHISEALPMDGIPLEASARRRLSIDARDCGKAMDERSRAAEGAAVPSLVHAAVTEIATKGAPAPPRSAAGRGRAFGQVVHHCLKAAARGITLTPTVVASYLAELERPPEEGEAALDLVRSVQASDLWRRLLASPERHAEVPFALSLDGAEVGLAKGPTLLQGIIDLVFRENGRWVLVDYKTDRVEGDLQPYVDYYAPQVRLYAQAWKRLSGQPAAEALLFFTHTKEACRVELTE